MKFRELSIKAQLRIIIMIMFAAFLSVSVLISYSTREVIYHTEDEHIRLTGERLGNQLNLLINKMRIICGRLAEDESVARVLQQDYDRTSDWMHGIETVSASYLLLDPVIEDVALSGERIHYSGVYSERELEEIEGQMTGMSFSWLGFRPHNFSAQVSRPDMFCFAAGIDIPGETERGIVVISVSTASYNMVPEENTGCFYAVTDGERILWSFGTDTEEAEQALALSEGSTEKSIRRGNTYIHRFMLDEPDFYLISGMNTARAGVTEQLGRIRLLTYSSIAVAALLCLLLILTLAFGVIRPLAQFDRTIRGIREKNAYKHEVQENIRGCAEITQISREFDLMLRDIDELNRKIFHQTMDLYELKVEKQEAELAYLKSQVNPHFLYNTLEVIRTIAIEKDAPQIVRMTSDMASIFRYSAKGEEEVRLEDEIRITEAYVRIQQQRFAGKIDVYFFIPEELYPCRVIKMLLQPLVENAIFHGLEPVKGKGSLFVGARREEDRLILTVKDDGAGIPAEQLKELQEALKREYTDTSAHVGVLNTNARIRLQYGADCGLQVESAVGDGTTVTIVLPVILS